MSDKVGSPKLPWRLETIQVPKSIYTAEIELSQTEVEIALAQYVRNKFDLKVTENAKLISSGVAWKSSEFIVRVTRDE